ncbi:MAG: hypothetical protein U0R81_03345 [Mycobacterium sp.]
MTDDESTRPISVAELLAKNGTSAAPPAGGHRRRRRGNSDEVSVAELTGEIPVIRTGEIPVVPEESTADAGDAEAKPEAKPDLLEVEESDAEQMAPDPVDESAVLLKIAGSQNEPDTHDDEDLQSYLTASAGTLFSGGTVADDLARAGGGPAGSADEAADGHAPAPGKLAALWRACLAVLQSLFAVAFGAGLFIAFDQLWRWNNIVALVLSVLVILGLVVAVRVVRKTEDIVSTLIAVAVGALVTLGPLALLQSI